MSGKLSDSPWFWLLLFGAAAVAALAAIGPKHVRRQERLVRMQAARERMPAGAVAKSADGSAAEADDFTPPAIEPPQVSTRPLMMFLASALFVAALVVGWIQIRKSHSPPDAPPGEVRG